MKTMLTPSISEYRGETTDSRVRPVRVQEEGKYQYPFIFNRMCVCVFFKVQQTKSQCSDSFTCIPVLGWYGIGFELL